MCCSDSNEYHGEKEGSIAVHVTARQEVANSMQEQLHLSKHDAKSTWGVMTRMAAQVTAHSVGMMMNKLLGRSLLRLADLAV